LSTCFHRFNGAVIAVVTVDNLHTLLGNLNIKRRDRFASDKRIAKSATFLVDFADVQARLDVEFVQRHDKRPVHFDTGSVFIFGCNAGKVNS
jgi:hypothetical protein